MSRLVCGDKILKKRDDDHYDEYCESTGEKTGRVLRDIKYGEEDWDSISESGLKIQTYADLDNGSLIFYYQ